MPFFHLNRPHERQNLCSPNKPVAQKGAKRKTNGLVGDPVVRPLPTIIMKMTPAITTLIAVLLFAGCSKSDSGTPSASESSAYPKDAAAVTADPAYKRGFFSGLTGTAVYVRRLAKDEVATMPKEYVISDKNTSVLVVPIKDGKIVALAPVDRAGSFFSKSPEEMLK